MWYWSAILSLLVVPLSTSVNLHGLKCRWQATKIVLEFSHADFWLSAEN